eukprot:9406038-Alexandrium_andersonii.AAC.1
MRRQPPIPQEHSQRTMPDQGELHRPRPEGSEGSNAGRRRRTGCTAEAPQPARPGTCGPTKSGGRHTGGGGSGTPR